MPNASSCVTLRIRKGSAHRASRKPLSYEPHHTGKMQLDTAANEAFQEMFVASRQKFVARAYLILRNIEDAEDAVQNAFISGYLHLHNFQGRSALKTWFTRIVLNAALMIRRKRKPIEPLLTSEWTAESEHWMDGIPSPEPDPEMCCAKAEELEVIHDVSAQLQPRLREAFSIYYGEDISVHEASLVTGLSASTFKARLFRARREVISGAKRAVNLRSQKRLTDVPSLSAA